MGLFRRRAEKNRENAETALLNEQASAAGTQAETARPEMIAEERPNPDQPGWGRILGQEIGKARANHDTSQK